jgi:hypothetical protein
MNDENHYNFSTIPSIMIKDMCGTEIWKIRKINRINNKTSASSIHPNHT